MIGTLLAVGTLLAPVLVFLDARRLHRHAVLWAVVAVLPFGWLPYLLTRRAASRRQDPEPFRAPAQPSSAAVHGSPTPVVPAQNSGGYGPGGSSL